MADERLKEAVEMAFLASGERERVRVREPIAN